jgi:mannosyl-oligosaccharide alpha-1,2-mannosidase
MLRYRRYRIFVAFAVVSLFALYRFGSSSTSWKDAAPKQPKSHKAASSWRPHPHLAHETKKLDIEVPAAKATQSPQRPPPIAPVSRPTDNPPPDVQLPTDAPPELADSEEGLTAVVTSSTSTEQAHWEKQTELFPVPSTQIIRLPTGKPVPIAKIQHEFRPESALAKAEREQKLGIIKDVFKRSWDGYVDYAWMQDELSPVSGKFRNPFASWGATLVDSLDTLWIMGMKEEFAEAAKAVDKIDFTTTPRSDIPLFETTIRYLGGLLAAYDVSGGKYDNLLNKAVELAEVLISAFDTPNRMPETYYYWSSTTQTRRAPYRVVLAEIGSLSVEFTRLAQITGEQKYYDAIARITDNLEEFQDKTRLPGMWPAEFDASGCKEIKSESLELPSPSPVQDLSDESAGESEIQPTATTDGSLSPNGKKYKPLDLPSPVILIAENTEEPLSLNEKKYKPLDLPSPIVFIAETATSEPSPTKGTKFKPLDLPDPVVFIAETTDATPTPASSNPSSPALERRQLDDPENIYEEEVTATIEVSFSVPPLPSPTAPECQEQGFASSPGTAPEEYTLGGMSDSTYEYLPKEWLLLGGQVNKYRTMYEKSVEVVKKNLLFRPMLPNKTDVLFSGKLVVPLPDKGEPELEAENAHLTCFAGGMFGMAARIFNRPDDLEIAKKLTEGCIWSYDMTATGIMPEAFIAVPCTSIKHCEWNETKYWEALDPSAELRFSSYKSQIKFYKEQMASASVWYSKQLAAMTAAPTSTALNDPIEAIATPTPSSTPDAPLVETELESGFDKRQLDEEEPETPFDPKTIPGWKAPDRKAHNGNGISVDAVWPPTPVQVGLPVKPDSTLPEFPSIWSPSPPMTHEEYVQSRLNEERLPPGVISVKAKGYILR